MSRFVHLHLHTNYSLLDGAINIKELARYLKETDMKKCAITDHGAMFGVVKFYKEMKHNGIKPIIGCECYTTRGSRFERAPENNHLVLLCQDKEGYKNLSRLVTQAYTEGFYYKPRMDRDLLEKHSKGLIALSACLKGEIASLLLQNRDEEAKSTARWYRDLFDGRFYLEMQDNGIEEQYLVNEKIVQLSMELNIPLVATNDCHYINKKDAFVQDVLVCVSTKKTLDDPNRMKMSTNEFYVKTADEMMQGYFKEYPQAIANTLKIADQCEFSFKTGVHYLPVMGKNEDESARIIEEKSAEGLKKKTFPVERKEEYDARLKHELSIIQKMGYSSYYLIVADFIEWARANNVPVGPGRGSGAASLVAYCLGITNLDPIRYDLIFERFLNPERVSLPDFDIDFCSRRREDVYNYLVGRYGQDYVTRIATFGFLKAKSAIKDIGRVLGYSVKETQDISDLVPFLDYDKGENLRDAVEKEPALKRLVKDDPRIGKLVELAEAIEGSVRNYGVHAGGVIISSIPVLDIVPLIPADDVIATQFDMKDVEEVGLVKFDLLAIETLTIIDDAVQYIKRFKDAAFDIDKMSLDDPNIYNMLASGDTVGVFQLESPGMQKLLRNLKPDCFEDVIAVNALYRPGPLEGGMVDQFINRKHGREEIEYPFAELEPILKETYGIIVYQEQVQRIASTLAGYTMGEADLLRRAMGKKKAKEMEEQKVRFLDGAKKNGHDLKKADELFELMAKFAGYGFNKAHAAVYAFNAYVTAYLKYYYPVEFLSSLLTSKMNKDFEAADLYISDALAHGIKLLPPDVNESVLLFEPRGKCIRFGFGGIKNVGSAAINAIMEERGNNGLFKTFYDFCLRVDTRKVSKKTIECLVKAGAFDSFGMERGLLFSNIEKFTDEADHTRKEKESGQFNLFGDASKCETKDTDVLDKTKATWTKAELLAYEKEMVGFYVSSHPMDNYDKLLRAACVPEVFSIQQMPADNYLIAAGIITLQREIATERGVFAVFSLQDKTGSVELVAYSDVYKEMQKKGSFSGKPVVCKCRVSDNAGKNKLILENIKELEDKDFSLSLKFNGPAFSKEKAEQIKNMIRSGSGQVNVTMELVFPNEGAVELDLGKTELSIGNSLYDSIRKGPKKDAGARWHIDF